MLRLNTSYTSRFARVVMLICLFLLGLIFSVSLFIFTLELLLIYPQGDVYSVLQNYTPRFEELPQTWQFDIVQQHLILLTSYYFSLAKHAWLSWGALIIGLLLSKIAIRAFLSRIGAGQSSQENATHYRDLFSKERRKRKQVDFELEAAKEQLTQVHEHILEGVIILKEDERLIQLNERARTLIRTWLGEADATVTFEGTSILDLIPGYLSSGFSLSVQETINKKMTIEKEVFLEPVGAWLSVRVYPTPEGAHLYFRDITAEKKPEELYRASEVLLNEVGASAPLPMAIVDLQWHYVLATNAWKEAFHLNGDLKGQSHKKLLPRFPEKITSIEKKLKTGTVVKSEEALPFHLNGEEEWVEWEVRPWRDQNDQTNGYIIYAQLVTESVVNQARMKEQREKEQKLAYHDILTGLPNRQLFYDRLTMALAQAYRQLGKVGLMFLDLDGFKAINDNLGHDAGDMLLKQVSERLKKCIRDTDTLARLGGDEFVVILTGIREASDVARVGEKIIRALDEPFDLAGKEGKVTTSIGIGMYPSDASTTSELIKKADTAMYWAKEGGKNQYRFFADGEEGGGTGHSHSASGSSQNHLEAELRTALQKGELEVVFQPQFNLKTMHAFGVEALLRWNHPKLGRLAPGKFLETAEQSGLILPIGEWVMKTACEMNLKWKNEGHKRLRVTVNLSKRQLEDKNLLARVQRVLKQTGMPAPTLGVEISESVIIDGGEQIQESLKALHNLGIYIIVDDFGLAYAPLSHLKNYPVDMIKVHQSFVHRAVRNAEDRAIVKSIITLAQNMRIDILGEGVEKEEQADFLLENGCSNVQGYLYSKPIQPAGMVDFFRPLNSSQTSLVSQQKPKE